MAGAGGFGGCGLVTGFFFDSSGWLGGEACASTMLGDICARALGLSVAATTPDRIVPAKKRTGEGLMLLLLRPRKSAEISSFNKCKGAAPPIDLSSIAPERRIPLALLTNLPGSSSGPSVYGRVGARLWQESIQTAPLRNRA